MLFVALAAGIVQITTRAIEVPVGVIKIPAPAIQVRASAVDLLTGGAQTKMRFVPTMSNAESNSPPEEFQWAGTMHEHQTVEVHLARGSIQVLPSRNDTVHVEARTDNPSHSEIQAVSTRNGVKFCNIVTGDRESRNYCEPGQGTSRIQEDQPFPGAGCSETSPPSIPVLIVIWRRSTETSHWNWPPKMAAISMERD